MTLLQAHLSHVSLSTASTFVVVLLYVAAVMVAAYVLWKYRKCIRRVKVEFSTNLKIVIGLMQVLVLLECLPRPGLITEVYF